MDEELAALTVGKTGHSRWLTTANLFCDWWCSRHGLQEELLERLREIVDFIVNVYYPCWFRIKLPHSWIDGPSNILFKLSCLKTQPKVMQLTVMPTVRSSAWFAHSESVLQSMLCSHEREEREFAVDKIISIRGEMENGEKSVRLQKLPYLSIEAISLEKLISWDEASEPITTCNLTKKELEQVKEEKMRPPYFCCHTQGIERAVKEVIAAAESVFGEERRDGFIRGRAGLDWYGQAVSGRDYLFSIYVTTTA